MIRIHLEYFKKNVKINTLSIVQLVIIHAQTKCVFIKKHPICLSVRPHSCKLNSTREFEEVLKEGWIAYIVVREGI